MKELETSENLEVGDVLIVKNAFFRNEYKITRVSKKIAYSKRDDGYEYKFKRQFGFNMSYPHERWNTSDYKAYRN